MTKKYIVKKDDEVAGEEIKNIIKQLKAIDNKHRRQILEICSKEPKTISQLTRELDSSLKVTWNNIKQLEDAGFVMLKEKKKEKHHPVYVQSIISPTQIVDNFKQAFIDNIKLIDSEKATNKQKK